MQLHRNAKTTPRSRLEIVRRLEIGQRADEIAEGIGVSVRTVYKWRQRFREGGRKGLEDRRSTRNSLPATRHAAFTRATSTN